jgi:hypothetical protein
MKFVKTVLVTTLAIASTQALAWSDREQGFLAGIGAVILGQHLANSQQARPVQQAPAPIYMAPAPIYVQPPVYMQPAPVYTPPPLPVCQYRGQEIRLYDQYGNVIASRYCY